MPKKRKLDAAGSKIKVPAAKIAKAYKPFQVDPTTKTMHYNGNTEMIQGTSSGGYYKSVKGRKAHSFRQPSLALNRVLTYLAEKIFFQLKYDGIAEVQIGWVAGLNSLLIAENQVEAFKAPFEDLQKDPGFNKIISSDWDYATKTHAHGTAAYFNTRLERHHAKLCQLLKKSSQRYQDWIGLDANVKRLIKFLNDIENKDLYVIKDLSNIKVDKLEDSIVIYSENCAPAKSAPNRHAELYHLQVFRAVEAQYNNCEYYVAGTKRACSTCAGEIRVSQSNNNPPNLHADGEHPGLLWGGQHTYISDDAKDEVWAYLTQSKTNMTEYEENKKPHYTSGFGSDSESDVD